MSSKFFPRDDQLYTKEQLELALSSGFSYPLLILTFIWVINIRYDKAINRFDFLATVIIQEAVTNHKLHILSILQLILFVCKLICWFVNSSSYGVIWLLITISNQWWSQQNSEKYCKCMVRVQSCDLKQLLNPLYHYTRIIIYVKGIQQFINNQKLFFLTLFVQ